jgi:hypothetical protein
MIRRSTFFGIAASAAVTIAHVHAYAAPPTREECVESHGKGQDLREQGHLAEAKRLFLVCAQQTCPALVQSDCAKFGEELARTVPSVSFSARDARGGDLPDTQVFVDDQLVASRLDEGKAFDLDPGKHSVKFVRAGVEPVVVTAVVAVGEKGRNISATFGEKVAPTTTPTPAPTAAPPPTTEKEGRSAVPLVVAGVGFAAGVTGLVLGIVGVSGVPDACDSGNHKCKAAPGDPVFDDAKSSMGLANIGLALGIGGAVVGVGGLVWYLLSGPKERDTTAAKIAPSVRANGFQLSF